MQGMATEITTERLVLRDPVPADAAALAARRSDPEVARHQSWEAPFSLERAEPMVTDASGLSGLVVDEWSMVTVAERDGAVVGDIAVLLTWDGRVADIGYTFASEHWGKGYAVEAVEAVVRWLFEERAVERVAAGLNPENVASAMVLERTGFEFEGRKIQAYWTDDGTVSDDAFYGMTRKMWEAWTARPTGPPTDVRLVEIEDWRTDIYTRITLQWRLSATVYDRAGNSLGSAFTQGKSPVARTSVTGEYNKLATDQLSEKLSRLLNERQITDALK